MKVIEATELGPPQNYHLRERPLPIPAAGEVRVQIKAAGIGYVDVLLARGEYQIKPAVPFVPGTEFAGIVDAVGAGVTTLQVGDRVCGQGLGNCFAEYVTAAPVNLCAIPAHTGFDAAAIFFINYHTALYALQQKAGLRAGETVLVLGAAGGVGSACIQVARAMGARVIAAASSEKKREFALQQGAHELLDYSVDTEIWRGALRELTKESGLDVVIDPVGGAVFEPAFRSLSWGGRHIVIGFAAGAIGRLPANLPLLKGADLRGADIRQFSAREPAQLMNNSAQLYQWLSDDVLHPVIGATFAFTEFRQAMELAGSGTCLGKVVLQISVE